MLKHHSMRAKWTKVEVDSGKAYAYPRSLYPGSQGANTGTDMGVPNVRPVFPLPDAVLVNDNHGQPV